MPCYLDEINEKYGSDKSKYNYGYDELLFDTRGAAKNVLEIGIYHGQSIRMWLEYFWNAKVYGIDNNSLDKEGCEKYVDVLVGDRFQYFIGDGADKGFLEKTIGGVMFDVIIDDASHVASDQVKTFNYLKDKIVPGGYYFCEDIPLVQNLTDWWTEKWEANPLTFIKFIKARQNPPENTPELLAVFRNE